MNSVSSINSTSNRISKSVNIGKIKSILANNGVTVANALLTAIKTESLGFAFGKSENTLTRIVWIKSSIYFYSSGPSLPLNK